MSKLATRISSNSITIVLDGRVRTVHNNAANFKRLSAALKKPEGAVATWEPDLDVIRDLVDISSFIAKETHGKVTVSSDQVRYDGKVVHGVIAGRILQHLTEGYSIAPLANFLNKLMLNPVEDVRTDLFEWLDKGEMPIADDGDIIAYKNVQQDYYSYHSGRRGKVLHAMGTVVSMPREEVDANRRNECSTGLHFCSYSYLSNYNGGSGRTLIVKINPADVVAIPTDYNRAKGRAWRMFVFDEVVYENAKKALVGTLIAPRTGVIDTETTARISDENDNNLGDDGKGQMITIGRLRGLLAHGGIDYTAEQLGVKHDRVTALAEIIDFKDENMGKGTAAPAQPIAKSSPVETVLATPAKQVPAPVVSAKVKKATKKVSVKKAVKAVKAAAKPAAVAGADASGFEHNGKTFSAQEVLDGLAAHGQRGYSKLVGVPRTTLQTWKAKIEKA